MHQWKMGLSYINANTDRPAQIEAGGKYDFTPGTSREQAQEIVKRLLTDHLAGDPQQSLDRAYVPNVVGFTLDPDDLP